MSPRNLVLLLLVGLCATQAVYGHRQAQGINELFSNAKRQLDSLIRNVEDAAGSSVDVVKKYMGRVEDYVLDAASAGLKSALNIDVDLHVISDIVKDDIKVCTKDDGVKSSAKAILTDLKSCVTDDIQSLKNLVTDMKDMWNVAKNIPETMESVSKQCSEHVQLDAEDAEDDDEEFAAKAQELLDAAEHRVSRRELDFLRRATRCMKAVFSLSKTDLATIPGEMISASSNALKIWKSAKVGIPACVAQKLAANTANMSKLGLQVGACVSTRLAENKTGNADLAKLNSLVTLAKHLNAMKDSKALEALSTVSKFIG